jgi:homeobox protein homothorax
LKIFVGEKCGVLIVRFFCVSFAVYTHPGPSGGYPDPMSYMMDGQAQMMHRPPGDPGFHQGYHYPPAEYYPHHL